jgi:pyruvate,orthophosphate dikinase
MSATDICSLDYLVGTLATAYKGMVASLVARDVCITAGNNTTEFRGTVMSLPAGKYIVVLMHGGIEISRDELQDGFFRLSADSAVIAASKSLQIDIVQNGRHIGTFLLKKETPGGMFASALEVSQDLRGIKFKALVDSVKDREGIRKAAELLISQMLSTKKDWKSLSEDINSFSKDVFWIAREAFYLWHDVLVRFSLKACENAAEGSKARALSNVLSLVELPLEQETDMTKLEPFAETWLRGISSAGLDLSLQARHVLRIAGKVKNRLPCLNIDPFMKAFLSSLKGKAKSAPVLKKRLIDLLGKSLSEERLSPLIMFSEGSRSTFVDTIDEIEKELEKGTDSSLLLGAIGSLDIHLLDREDMFSVFFDTLTANLETISDRDLADALSELEFDGILNEDLRRALVMNIRTLLKDLLTRKKKSACRKVLEMIQALPVRDDILLSPEMARSILRSNDEEMTAFYRGLLRGIIVPPPKVSGLSPDTWAEKVNPSHLRRLAAFLEVIAVDAGQFLDILVHLVGNLFISGVWIPDDRLFQRDISSYLNSGAVQNNFLLHYLLLKRLPSYYSEVGASGRIRDLTTEIDSWGNDTVLYFLRKQVHVNASSNNVALIERIITAWLRNEPALLNDRVPEDVLAGMKKEMLGRYSSAMRELFTALDVLKRDGVHFGKLLDLSDEDIDRTADSLDTTEEIRRKIVLLCRIYREVKGKYAFRSTRTDLPADLKGGFAAALERLRDLKTIYTSPERTEPRESLYYKRHIAFGIPSVIGSYHEPKFDALSETFRIEERLRLLIEDVILQVEKSGEEADAGTLRTWIDCLEPLCELFKLHGLGNSQVGEVLTILKTNRLSLSQITDLLKIWQRELTWMVELCYRTFHKPLTDMLGKYPREDLSDFLLRYGADEKNFIARIVDITIRDIISSIAGFEELDRLLNSLIKRFSSHVESGRDIRIPGPGVTGRREWFALYELSPAEAAPLAPLLGNKAGNLISLKDKGLPVPCGTVFPSDITKSYQDHTSTPEFLLAVREAVGAIERCTGLSFGSGENPLFLAVRSGSYISMPGVLSSVLYCGMNRDTLEGFIHTTGDAWLACDSYRRFIEHYAEVVLGAEAVLFEQIQKEILGQHRGKELRELDTTDVKEIVDRYLSRLEKSGRRIPDDPYEQLRQSVRAIYRSWFSSKAVQFRKAMAVSEDWGTSVTLMNMVYANRRGSGASVFFTRIPISLAQGIFGEMREAATGDDLVYGRFTNRPLSRQQTSGGDSLEERDPELFRAYNELSARVETAMGNLPQEVESAYVTEGDRRLIYVLQTKRMEFRRGPTERFHASCAMESSVVGRGIGVHGGALSGAAIFTASPEHIRKLKESLKQPLILLRKETSTDDVSAFPEISGIATSVGGVTSHAAILSQKFDITAVVGCSGMKIVSDTQKGPYAILGDYEVHEGMSISIDGATGLVYSGVCLFTVREEHFEG